MTPSCAHESVSLDGRQTGYLVQALFSDEKLWSEELRHPGWSPTAPSTAPQWPPLLPRDPNLSHTQFLHKFSPPRASAQPPGREGLLLLLEGCNQAPSPHAWHAESLNIRSKHFLAQQ